uniref:Uncharacterized protein n=1 Tax=Rousettus aegyptiacus TaxID=9407 RepID=A0A7J8FJ99_ROUAE|nr:hypothetical protein HJG63_012161 [Rousettus aegyptiacus]
MCDGHPAQNLSSSSYLQMASCRWRRMIAFSGGRLLGRDTYNSQTPDPWTSRKKSRPLYSRRALLRAAPTNRIKAPCSQEPYWLLRCDKPCRLSNQKRLGKSPHLHRTKVSQHGEQCCHHVRSRTCL